MSRNEEGGGIRWLGERRGRAVGGTVRSSESEKVCGLGVFVIWKRSN
jgi:hypothetical protein